MTDDPRPSITCLECGRISYHPQDVEHGYCGNCCEYTTGVINWGGTRNAR